MAWLWKPWSSAPWDTNGLSYTASIYFLMTYMMDLLQTKEEQNCSTQIILAVFLLVDFRSFGSSSQLSFCVSQAVEHIFIYWQRNWEFTLCVYHRSGCFKSSMYNFISIKIARKMKQPSANITQNILQRNYSDYFSIFPLSSSFFDQAIQSSHCYDPSNSSWDAR